MNLGRTWPRLGSWFIVTVLVLLGLKGIWTGWTPAAVQSQPALSIVRGQDAPLIGQGAQISIAGKTYPVAWSQWQSGGITHTGLSDTGAMQTLGLTLLDSDNPRQQPVEWFSAERWNLNARLISPHRYLDVTDLLQTGTMPLQAQGNTLVLPNFKSQITALRAGNQPWGKRVVLELSQPTFWQMSQAKQEAVVMVNAQSAPPLNAVRSNTAGGIVPSLRIDDDDLGGSGSGGGIRYRLEATGDSSRVHFQLPVGYKLQISTLANPTRLVVDARPDGIPTRRIQWAEGIQWQQQTIGINSGQFPVTVVKIDPRQPNISLRPMMTNPGQAQGTGPLVTIARQQGAAIAINAGFFNRKNQLPLGAIRADQNWLSGPILNRGAIAWDDQGQMELGRLALTETLTTDQQQRFTLRYLNSAYVQKGLARYTPAWGKAYVPLTDNEIVYVVQQGQVTAAYPLGKAGQSQMPIPRNGYLIIDRGGQVQGNALAIGTRVRVEAQTQPAQFARYPNLIAGGPLLLDNGRIVLNAGAEKFSRAFQQQKASRSAVAIDGKNNILLVAVHNRIGGKGASLGEFAQLLQRLGATGALNLDGGSSTSLALGGHLLDRSPVTAAKVSNCLGVFLREAAA